MTGMAFRWGMLARMSDPCAICLPPHFLVLKIVIGMQRRRIANLYCVSNLGLPTCNG